MIQKSTILLASISLGLVACGGGGGGGGTTTGDQVTNTVSRTPSGIPVLPTASGSKRVGYIKSEVVTENMPAPPAQLTPANFKYNQYVKFKLPDGRLAESWSYDLDDNDIDGDELLLIDGKLVTDDEEPFTGDTIFFHPDDNSKDNMTKSMSGNAFAFIGDDGKSYGVYQFFEDPKLSYDLKAHESGSHRWTNVRYSYITALDGQKPIDLATRGGDGAFSYVHDGTITVNGDQWNAVLGNVTLDGKISGTDVAGTATGNFYGQTIKGEFAGFDGTSRPKGSDKTYQPGTVGGFMGQSDTAVFTGTWITDEATKFSQ